MRKILFLISFLFLVSSATFASDFSQYCSENKVSKTFGGSLASLSGVNFLSRNIIEGKIEKALEKETNSKFNVNVESFYGANVLGGEFASFKAKSDSFFYNGVYFSNLDVETICPYNRVSYVDEKLLFDENLVLKFSTEITQDDLNKTLESSEYKKMLDKMSRDKFVSTLIKIEDTKIEIKDKKLYFTYKIAPLPMYDILSFAKTVIKPFEIVFSADLKVENGEVRVCDFDINSSTVKNDVFLPFINKLTPTSLKLNIDKNNQGKMEIQNAKIEESKIALEGYILMPKKAQ